MVDFMYAAAMGVVAGLIPVYLGLLPLTAIRKVSDSWKTLLVSLSTGILLFLFADVTGDATRLANQSNLGSALFAIGIILGLAGPAMISRRSFRHSGNPERRAGPLGTAYTIAGAIGLHNLGEGLAIGAAYGTGQFALTALLIFGFAVHNGTEGLGILGPLTSTPVQLRDPLAMGFIAGFPTVLGSVLGSATSSGLISALFFSAAAGALLYVIIEMLRVVHSMKRDTSIIVGIMVGVLLMYATGLLVG